jgi:hypothetical protein
MPTNCNTRLQRSNLFLVRLWIEDAKGNNSGAIDENDARWRGKIQRVVNGETIEFQGWQGLVTNLSAMLSPGRADAPSVEAGLDVNDATLEEV